MRRNLPRTAAAGLLTVLIVLSATFVAVLPGGAVSSAAGARASSASAIPLMGENVSNIDTESPSGADADINAAAALGATVVRTELEWSIMQPSGPSSYDPRAIAYADRLVADASAHHIRVILLVDSATCWDTSAPADVLKSCATRGTRASRLWRCRLAS